MYNELYSCISFFIYNFLFYRYNRKQVCNNMEQAVADDGIGGLNRRWYWRIESTTNKSLHLLNCYMDFCYIHIHVFKKYLLVKSL